MDKLIYIFIVLLQATVFIIYLKGLFEFRLHYMYAYLLWFAMELFNMLFSYITDILHINASITSLANSIIYFLCLFIISMTVCNSNWKKKFLFTMLYGVFVMVCETIIVSLILLTKITDITTLTENLFISYSIMILTQAITFCLIIIILTIKKYLLLSSAFTLKWTRILFSSVFCTVIVILMGINMINSNDVSFNQILALLVIVFLNFGSYYMYSVQQKEAQALLKNQLFQKQIDLYKEHYTGMQKAKKQVSSINHDIKNHLSVLKALSSSTDKPNERLTEIREYINSVDLHCQFDGYNTNSGNMVLDALLDIKKGYAVSLGISTKIELFIPSQLNYDNMDLVVILANLFDNAIEACQKSTENPQIYLSIRHIMNNLYIDIENTYDGNMDGQKGDLSQKLLKTTKSDKSIHGIGMVNVLEVVEKYNGTMHWIADNHKFQINVFIYGNQ